MVESFSWLEKNTALTKEQINFLKEYKKPFTIITDCPRIKMILELDQEDFKYENKDEYKKIAFRVAHNDFQKKLISDI
jgi:heterodisulfide reductase subunit B